MKIVKLLASLTLAALPLYIIRCKSFSWCRSPLPFTLLELLILATFFAWAVWRVSAVKKEKKTLQRLFKGLTGPLFWPLVLFLMSATIAVFVSPDLRAAAGIWKAYFIEPVLFFVVVLDLSIEKRSLSWAVVPLLFSGLWLSALAIWQAISGTNQFAQYAIAQGRVSSVYTTPNALGLYLGPLVALSLGFLFQLFKQKRIELNRFGLAWYLIICLLAFIAAIILSKSRGAALGIIVALLAFLLMVIYPLLSNYWQRLLRLVAVFAVVAYFLLNFFVFVGINNLVTAYQPRSQDSIAARFCIWQATKNILEDRPITGIGLSGFPKVYPDYATCEKENFQYPHNIFLNFWTEIGIVGLLSFLWVVYRYWKILSPLIDNFVVVGLLAAMVYIFIHGLVDVPYFKNDLAVEFWVFLTLGTWFYESRLKEKAASRFQRPRLD
jgi:O-antigen ligase